MSPRPPGLQGGAPFPGVEPTALTPGWAQAGDCHCVGTSKRALLLKDGAADPLGVPSPPSLFLETTKEGKVPALGFMHPPHSCSPHTVILLSCPRRPSVGWELPRKHGGVTFWPFLLSGQLQEGRGQAVLSGAPFSPHSHPQPPGALARLLSWKPRSLTGGAGSPEIWAGRATPPGKIPPPFPPPSA